MNHYETDSAACDLRVHGFIWGKQRPRQNNADENGTCRTRPGRLASKRTLTVSMDYDGNGALSAQASGMRAC